MSEACQSTDAINSWTCFFSGFTQGEGTPTPLEKIHRRVSQRLAAPDCVVTLNTWRDSVRDRAKRIQRWRNGKPPRIVVVGYSYGGWSANNLCRELQKFDLEVEALLLCDPVGRIFGHLPSVFSMLNIIPLTVPANVRNLWTWRQVYDRPRGAAIRLAKDFSAMEANEDKVNAGTIWHADKVKTSIPHVNMDDLNEFSDTVRKVACGVSQ
jgi:pimeloyl-ACP methyl ester carboxylesterase